jgi:hypothetical protein
LVCTLDVKLPSSKKATIKLVNIIFHFSRLSRSSLQQGSIVMAGKSGGAGGGRFVEALLRA